MIEKLLLLLLAAQEGRPLVECTQQTLIGEQCAKVAGQEFFLQGETHPGACIPNVCLDVRHGQHVSREID